MQLYNIFCLKNNYSANRGVCWSVHPHMSMEN